MNTRLEGDTTMAGLAATLRIVAGREVIDRTGLPGFYRVVMTFSRDTPVQGSVTAAPPAPGDPPSLFTAIQEQLGLRLAPANVNRDVLMVDQVTRPTEN